MTLGTKREEKVTPEEEHLLLSERYETVSKPIESTKEVDIPIVHLQVFPMRGLYSDQLLDYIDVSPYRVRYDRELTALDAKTMKYANV